MQSYAAELNFSPEALSACEELATALQQKSSLEADTSFEACSVEESEHARKLEEVQTLIDRLRKDVNKHLVLGYARQRSSKLQTLAGKRQGAHSAVEAKLAAKDKKTTPADSSASSCSSKSEDAEECPAASDDDGAGSSDTQEEGHTSAARAAFETFCRRSEQSATLRGKLISVSDEVATARNGKKFLVSLWMCGGTEVTELIAWNDSIIQKVKRTLKLLQGKAIEIKGVAHGIFGPKAAVQCNLNASFKVKCISGDEGDALAAMKPSLQSLSDALADHQDGSECHKIFECVI